LEHLLFKDSTKFNKQNGREITGYLDWLGAYVNATTWLDRTNYFEALPKEHLKDALELEADRMRGSLFSDADLASEMTVVRNEFERSRNNPFELLEEEVWGKAFTKHPYRIPTIGLKEDIEGSTAAKLREFYDKFYWPNNATLAVFGDVPWSEVEKLVLKYFGPIPSSPHAIPEMTIVEPPQKSPRSVSLKKPFGITVASLGYKIPQATHKDFPAILVLGMILAGGFSSRLQKRLVDTGVASDLSLSLPALRDPGFMGFTAHLSEGVDPKKALTIIQREIQELSSTLPEADEIARAKERLLTQIAYERDGMFIDIRAVSESIAAGDWTLGYRVEALIGRVKPADIERVAKTYLVPSGEVRGILENEEAPKVE
jgi:zinc protease